MNLKTGHKILILIFIFIGALALYFSSSVRRATSSDIEVYASREDSRFPLVWNYMFDQKMNSMHGYTCDVTSDMTYDSLTLLPEDRKLMLHIDETRLTIKSAGYEIRDRKLSQLVEQTKIREKIKRNGDTDVSLPIQNLLVKDVEYRLDFYLSTEESGEIHYYTRIMLTDDMDTARDMIELATTFSSNNLDYELAEKNTTYVETDGTADDTDLAYTTLKSTWNNLAYNAMKLTPEGEKDIRLSTYDGNAGEVYIRSTVSENSSRNQATYLIDETITMRMGTSRLYMMSYARHMNELFDGGSNISTGRRIMAGINEDSNFESLESSTGKYSYFVVEGDLWCYENSTGRCNSVCSFRTGNASDLSSGYNKHNIKMLKCDDQDMLTFILYGYMNSGIHEGTTGIAYMVFDPVNEVVTEKYYIPVNESYDKLHLDLGELAFLGDNSMLYIKIGDSIYGIDTLSGNEILIASGLKDRTYCISKNMDKLAWAEGSDPMGSTAIHILDTNLGVIKESRPSEGMLLCAEGFVGRDLVISERSQDNLWVINGVARTIPATAVEILDDDLNVLKHYSKEGSLINDIVVNEGRVVMTLFGILENGSFEKSGEDTLVSSVESPDRQKGYGSYISEDKNKVYYLQLPDSAASGTIRISDVKTVNDASIEVEGISVKENSRYYAYCDGRLAGTYNDIAHAVDKAYGYMGSVRKDAYVVYNRAGTMTSRVIGDYIEQGQDILNLKSQGKVLDMYGMPLKQALYYVGIKYDVLTYNDSGSPMVIYAYDRETISCYELMSGNRFYYGIPEATEMFAKRNNDFSCAFSIE